MMDIEKNALSLQRISNTSKMNINLKRQAAFSMLIRLFNENEGYIKINADVVCNTFNHENLVVNAKSMNGMMALAAGLDGNALHEAVIKKMVDISNQSKCIMSKIDPCNCMV